MHSSFGRTAAALSADRSKEMAVSLAVATAVLAAWVAWMVFARVPLYEVSASARLEAARAPHPLQAPIDADLERLEGEIRTVRESPDRLEIEVDRLSPAARPLGAGRPGGGPCSL